MSDPTTRIYDEFRSRLAAVRRRDDVAALIRGAFIAATALLVLCLIALLLEGVLYLEVPGRTILFWVLLCVAASLVALTIGRPVLRVARLLPHEPDVVTARRVGRRLPQVGDRIVNVLQLFHQRDPKGLSSTQLVDAAFEDARQEFASLDLSARTGASVPRRIAKVLGVTVVLTIILLALFPGTFMGAATRLLHHGQSFTPPVAFSFLVDPGDKEVVKGETVSIRVRVEGEPQAAVALSSRPEGQAEYETRMLRAAPDGTFADEFRSLKTTTSYYVHAGDIQSREYTLKVIDRPVVKVLRIQLQPPAYSGLPARQLDDNQGDVRALKGTGARFLVESSKELSSATLVLDAGSRTALRVDGRRATGELSLTKEHTYQIALTDKEGVSNADPITYTVKLLPDAYPTAAIVFPGRNVDIAENERIPLLFKITDDYGFSRLRLAYKLVQSRYEKPSQEFSFIDVPMTAGRSTEATVSYVWSLSNLHLVPEDVVSYYIEVFDNDNISGPKSAASETYTLRLPSLEEVFAEIEKGHELSLDALQQTLNEAHAAKEDLDELKRELRKDQQKMEWQEQKKAEELAKKYEEIQNKLAEVNKTLDQMVTEMEHNRVLSPETLEKYQQLQQLMQEMNSPEYAEAMKRLQQAMRQLNPQQLRQALEQFSFSEENFRNSIERTMNLLKRIQIEQRVDEAVRRAEKLIQRQEQLREETEALRGQDDKRANELAQQQQDLQQQLGEMKEQLGDLQKQMQEFPAEMPLSEMQEALDHLQESSLEQDLREIARQMQSQNMRQATEGQRGALQKMGQFMQRLQTMQNALRENQQRQVVNHMRRAIQDLLDLSRRQEDLTRESQRLERNSPLFRENAQGQMDAMQDLAHIANRLAELSQKTFSITPEMGKALGDAARKMAQGMQALEQRDGTTAGQQQAGAMASLNEAAQLLQAGMDGMMQGGGQGMGMAAFLQRLRQLSGMQQDINQGTQNLGELSAQQAAEMARLAGEQGMVRKSLEQLAKEAAQAGQTSKLLGDLNAIAQEMREVQTDLAQGSVNPETLSKQERILSRMLDSQRSMRERDYEKRRRAETGKDRLRTSPEEIDLTTRNGRNRLREDLLKALEEGYARDYQELIKQYFEALEQEQPHQ